MYGCCGPIFLLLWPFFPTRCKLTLFPSGRVNRTIARKSNRIFEKPDSVNESFLLYKALRTRCFTPTKKNIDTISSRDRWRARDATTNVASALIVRSRFLRNKMFCGRRDLLGALRLTAKRLQLFSARRSHLSRRLFREIPSLLASHLYR